MKTLKHIAAGSLFTAGLLAAAPLPKGTAAVPAVSSVRLLHTVPNPTGLQFGFWANYRRQGEVLADFGKRPVGRVDFTGWDKIETSRGVYDWAGKFENIKRSHRHGETVIAAINISFSPEITKHKNTIPAFYHPRITDPVTRAAAKRFLAEYVRELLKQAGTVYLSIDYEIIFNYHLYAPADLAKAQEWRDWYLEAADTVRAALRDAGNPGGIRLIPIVNGDPLKKDSLLGAGPAANPWLADVVAASDALGIDAYHMGPAASVTDPAGTMEILRFFTDNFSAGKDVFVCENGFTSVTEANPGITHARKGKYAGTEAEQSAYYERLFAAIEAGNRPDGVLHNRLRAFNIWSYMDNHSDDKGEYEIYFGLVRRDGGRKPAFGVVKSAMDRLEQDPFHRPCLPGTPAVLPGVGAACGRDLVYTSGTEYDCVELTVELPAEYGTATLDLATRWPGSVLVAVNGVWTADAGQAKSEFSIPLTRGLRPGAANRVLICLTGEVFPFRQQIVRMEVR